MTCHREKLPERPPKPAKYRRLKVENNSIKEDFQFIKSYPQLTTSDIHHTLQAQPILCKINSLEKPFYHHRGQYIAATTTTTVSEQIIDPCLCMQ